MINLADDELVWEPIYRMLRERIERGVYPQRGTFPSITKLEEEFFPVARGTIRKAIAQLEQERYTRAVSGKGRYVRPAVDWNPPPGEDT